MVLFVLLYTLFFFFKQKTAYEMRISDWSSDVCSSDLDARTMLHVPPSSRTRDGAIPPEVLASVETLLRWLGEDPAREGLIETPGRVARAWKDYCQGYDEDPAVPLSLTFEEVGGYELGRASGRERVCQ